MSLLSARNPWHCLSQVGYPDAPLYLKPPTLLLVQCLAGLASLDAPANASRGAPFRSDLRSKQPDKPDKPDRRLPRVPKAMEIPLPG